MRRVVPQALPLLLTALAAGCVQGAYNRATVDEPLRPEWLAALHGLGFWFRGAPP